jgi:hypothetical protein
VGFGIIVSWGLKKVEKTGKDRKRPEKTGNEWNWRSREVARGKGGYSWEIRWWLGVHKAKLFRLRSGGCDKGSPNERILMADRMPTRRIIINEKFLCI